MPDDFPDLGDVGEFHLEWFVVGVVALHPLFVVFFFVIRMPLCHLARNLLYILRTSAHENLMGTGFYGHWIKGTG